MSATPPIYPSDLIFQAPLAPFIDKWCNHAHTVGLLNAYANKYEQFAKTRAGPIPKILQVVLDMNEGVKPARNRVKREADRVTEANRTERIEALETVQDSRVRLIFLLDLILCLSPRLFSEAQEQDQAGQVCY